MSTLSIRINRIRFSRGSGTAAAGWLLIVFLSAGCGRPGDGPGAAEALYSAAANYATPQAAAAAAHVYESLHRAANAGYLPDVLRFIEDGADVNLRLYTGSAPLHQAAGNGHLEVVKCLLEHGARVNLKNRFGQTPYQIAVLSHHPEVAAYLKSKGGK